MEISLDQGGLLQIQGDACNQLALRFLKEFAGLESFITRFTGEFKNIFEVNW